MSSVKGALHRQPWIRSGPFDGLLIVGPPLLSGLLVFLFNKRFEGHHTVGPLLWLFFVVCIDVAHVYASLFRTYLDSSLEERALLWLVPLACWAIGAVLYSVDAMWFWSALAYLAVYHFVRQQYGFMMIYARGERDHSRLYRQIDKATIYAATLYPLIYWHTHLPRNFSWFIEGDFVSIAWPWLADLAKAFYVLILLAYICKEAWVTARNRMFNVPKNFLVVATALSWYLGIVWLNNDLAFTLTNVVSHGIPYMALIWIYGNKSRTTGTRWNLSTLFFSPRMLPFYVGFLILLAYLEEGFWDGFVWRDHSAFFPSFSSLPQIQNNLLLVLLVPLLALPQSTHYLFDAFLWRVNGSGSRWKQTLFKPVSVQK